MWFELHRRDFEYPSGGMLYLDGHYARMVFRRNEKPIIFRHSLVSESSYVPFLFSPLVVTGEKALPAYYLVELIMDATR